MRLGKPVNANSHYREQRKSTRIYVIKSSADAKLALENTQTDIPVLLTRTPYPSACLSQLPAIPNSLIASATTSLAMPNLRAR